MALVVSSVSLLTSDLGVATQTEPHIDAWAEGKARRSGAAIVGVTGAGDVIGQQLASGNSAQAGVTVSPQRLRERSADPRLNQFQRAAFASTWLASISDATDRSSDDRDRPDCS